MVMDYRDKKPIQNQPERRAIQNQPERRGVPKNKTRREPIGMIAFVSVVALLASFGAGLFTGWLVFKGRKPAAPVAAAAPVAKKDEVPLPVKPASAGNEPLTFYHTLPQGGKGALGSGLNLKKEEKLPAAPAAPAQASAPATAGGAAAPAAKEGSAKYVVQTASYREKKEAETARDRLTAKGLAAYVAEANTPEKGVWFRVRIGRHLSHEEAKELAGTAGQGAMVVAE